MASLDNNPTSYNTGALLRRHGSTLDIRHPRAISPWSIMARDACWCGGSRAFDNRVHAGAVRVVEEKRARCGHRFRVLDDRLARGFLFAHGYW